MDEPMDIDTCTSGNMCPPQSLKSPDYECDSSPMDCDEQETPEQQQQRGTENWLPPETSLSKFIERNVNAIAPPPAGRIFVRVMSTVSKVQALSEKSRQFLKNYNLPSEFPYKSRVLMCFQKTESNNDGYVAFFAVCTQEYDGTCPPPNRNSVYISMVDSVQLYEPARYRRAIFYTVLLSYLSFVRENGFKSVFLWSCPPAEGIEYIFHQRPSTQKTPTVEILNKWYVILMKTSVDLKILHNFNTLYQWCPKSASNFFQQFPFFHEDLWGDELDSAIKSYEAAVANGPPAQTKKKTKYIKSNKTPKKYERVIPSNDNAMSDLARQDPHVYVFEKVMSIMKENQDSFFRMTLKDPDSSNYGALFKVISDPETPSLFVDNRDYMADFLSQNQLKFCDIRTAQVSTAKFLKEVREEPLYIYCDICCKRVISGFFCQGCRFDECMDCLSKKFIHEHRFSTKIFCQNAENEWNSFAKRPTNYMAWKVCKIHWWRDFEKYLPLDDPRCLKILHHVKSCKEAPCSECRSFRDLCYFRLSSPTRDANSTAWNCPPVTPSSEISVKRMSSREMTRNEIQCDKDESLHVSLELRKLNLCHVVEKIFADNQKNSSFKGLSDFLLSGHQHVVCKCIRLPGNSAISWRNVGNLS